MKKLIGYSFLSILLIGGGTLPLGAQTKPRVTKQKVKRYPLGTCIVSGDKLGAMGKPVRFAYQGREIMLCCQDCRKDFDKDPARYLKKLEP